MGSTAKTLIVLEGLKGKPVAELCNEHQISQAQYYHWRDQFLSHAHKAFETQKVEQRELRLRKENTKLKNLVGELTLELKKTTSCWIEARHVQEGAGKESSVAGSHRGDQG